MNKLSSEEERMIIQTNSEEETIAIAARLAKRLRPGDVVALAGELGAGKTRFVRGLALGLGIDPGVVTSPTFVLLHEYAAADTATVLVHLDAYRLSGADELEALGWDELVGAGDAIIAIEWSERISAALPVDRLEVRLEHAGAAERLLEIVPWGKMAGAAPWKELMMRDHSEKQQGSVCCICGESTVKTSEFFPFCSGRCRLVDLGKWLGGKYVASRELTAGDEEV